MRRMKAEMDIMVETDSKSEEAKVVAGFVEKAMVAGVFDRLEGKGPNHCPVLFLDGREVDVVEFILKNYDPDPSNLDGYFIEGNHGHIEE